MKSFLLSTLFLIASIMGQEEESSFLFIPSQININVGETQKVLIKLVKML